MLLGRPRLEKVIDETALRSRVTTPIQRAALLDELSKSNPALAMMAGAHALHAMRNMAQISSAAIDPIATRLAETATTTS
mgnify:CR=1 FL=1